jgi:hypothetical protein
MLTFMTMLAELRDDNKQLAANMRETHSLCDEHGDVASASLLENWIDEAKCSRCTQWKPLVEIQSNMAHISGSELQMLRPCSKSGSIVVPASWVFRALAATCGACRKRPRQTPAHVLPFKCCASRWPR